MAAFKREERYIVVKLKDLNEGQEDGLRNLLTMNAVPTRECVVVEPDWTPVYDETWDAVQRHAEGRRTRVQEVEAERDELAAALADIRLAASFAVPGFAKEIERRTADPAAILSRMKARTAVEVLNDAAKGFEIDGRCLDAAQVLRITADQIQQAQED